MLLNCGVGEDSWESLGLQGDPTSQRKSILNIHWKDWCWSRNSSTLATWCEEPTYWKRSWCWERLKAGGEGDNRGWNCWMVSLTRWMWVWVNSRSLWWTGRSGVLQSMGSQSQTRQSNWTELNQKVQNCSFWKKSEGKVKTNLHIFLKFGHSSLHFKLIASFWLTVGQTSRNAWSTWYEHLASFSLDSCLPVCLYLIFSHFCSYLSSL